MIIRTEAIVLHRMKYGETSVIVTLFTRERGKISVIAKGARRTKSRFGSTLQPMSYIQVVFYYKPTRGLQTLAESSHVRRFPGIGRSLEKITLGLRMMELTEALMQEEEENAAVFTLLLQVFDRLESAEVRAANLLAFFQLRLAGLLGFAPAVKRRDLEALPERGGQIDLESGAIMPPDATPRTARPASRSVLRAYAVFARADLDAVLRMRLTDKQRRDVEGLIEDYLRYHFESSYPTRGEKVTRQLLRQSARGVSQESP